MNILVVDDDVDFADGLAEMLVVLGHEARAAYSCQDGLTMAAGSGFALAMVDIGLAGRDGADCARELQARQPKLKCVLMTGYSISTLEKTAYSTAGFTVLRKPLRMKDITRFLD